MNAIINAELIRRIRATSRPNRETNHNFPTVNSFESFSNIQHARQVHTELDHKRQKYEEE